MKTNINITKQIIILSFFILTIPFSVKCQEVIHSWATLATGASPISIAIDANGNVYTANYNNNTVSKITPTGVCTQNWATLATNAGPSSIAIDADGNVYTANQWKSTVSKITPTGVCTQNWATLATDANPKSIALDALGNIYIANLNNTISKITPTGVCTQNWATLPIEVGNNDIAIDAASNVYTANYVYGMNSTTSGAVSKITLKGVYTQSWATLVKNGTASTYSIAIDAAGNIYTANGASDIKSGVNVISSVSKITPAGVCTQNWATLATEAKPLAIAIDAAGNVYTANYYNNTVSKITPTGVCTQNWATLATGAKPRSIALDALGNIYIANLNNTVSKIVLSTALQDVSVDGYKVYVSGKNIIVENAIMGSSYAVYNIHGAEIISGKLSSNIIKLNSAIPAGVYFLKLNSKIAKVVL